MAIENSLRRNKSLDQITDEIANLIKHTNRKDTIECERCSDRLDQIQQALLELKNDIETKEVKAPLF